MSTDKIPGLKALWQQAFGDTDWFVDRFFEIAYAPDRCRYLEENGKILSALYWFDCCMDGEKWAYLYAVATDENYRGKGLCAALMAQTHRHLAENGYAGAVLMPAKPHLWSYYKKLGYTAFGGIRSFEIFAGDSPEKVETVDPDTYNALRGAYLPAHSLDQRGVYEFYRGWGDFYRGDGWLLAGGLDGDIFYAQEFFGDEARLPGVLRTLGASKGKFRTSGGNDPCGMYLKFRQEATVPGYLGFPLD